MTPPPGNHIRARRGAAWLSLAVALSASAPAQAPALPSGVTPAIAATVARGLGWLARHQSSNGAFLADDAGTPHPAAMTGLCGMALLASGSTPTRGRHWRELRRAVQFLLALGDRNDGLLADGEREASAMHAHGFATLFLASVHGMEEDEAARLRVRAALHRAVRWIEQAQNGVGGWYYRPDARDDEGSVTVTQLQALRACRMAGITVDKRTVDRAVDYLHRCQNPDGGIRYRYAVAGPSRPAITAAAVATLYSAGRYDDEPFVAGAFRYAAAALRRPQQAGPSHAFYAQLYFAEASYQRGGVQWDTYYAAVADWLLPQQLADGAFVGDGVGRAYGTAVALLVLQLPYALIPILQR